MIKKEICNDIFEITMESGDVLYRVSPRLIYIQGLGQVVFNNEDEIPQLQDGKTFHVFHFKNENNEYVYMCCNYEVL